LYPENESAICQVEILIRAENLTIQFENLKRKTNLKALRNVNFKINEAEFVAIIGPSGCGKSTLINAMAGFINHCEGNLFYRDLPIKSTSPERVVIFQNHSLFPWKTVSENLAFALNAKNLSADRTESIVRHYLKVVGLEKFADFYPKELSGGMQQRVGIARALAADPEVFLLDEPFASLDFLTREKIQDELMKMIRPLNKTAVLVTHNINEALFFADRIFIMSGQPGTIISELKIEGEKPNSILEIEDYAEFRNLKKQINDILKRGEIS